MAEQASAKELFFRLVQREVDGALSHAQAARLLREVYLPSIGEWSETTSTIRTYGKPAPVVRFEASRRRRCAYCGSDKESNQCASCGARRDRE